MASHKRIDLPRILWPVVMGILRSTGFFLLYFGIVSWAESSQHALEFFWQDRFIVIPIILGFGVQTGLYTVLKKRLFFYLKEKPASLKALNYPSFRKHYFLIVP